MIRCLRCAGEIFGDVIDVRFDGDSLTPYCVPCALATGQVEKCEGCEEPVPPAHLCVNERTGRRECSVCYGEWRKMVDPR